MSSRSMEIIGRYLGERIRFEGSDTIIGTVRLQGESREIARSKGVKDPDAPLTIKGEDDSTLEISTTYRFLGHFSQYTNRRSGLTENQFHFRTFVAHVPHDEEGIVRYLSDNGKGHGIGPSKAQKLVDTIGVDDVLRICRTEPESVAAVAKIDITLAKRFSEKLKSHQETENAKIELDRLLSGRGFPKSLASRLIKTYGNQAAATILDDPYQLMQFRGVGFKKADALYLDLKKDPRSIERHALYLWYLMDSDSSGDCWFSAELQVRNLQKMMGHEVDYRAAIIRGREFEPGHYGAIRSIRTNDHGMPTSEGSTLWLAEAKVAEQEAQLASLVAESLAESESHLLTIYSDIETTQVIPASIARCNRCGRALTSEEIYVLDGKPYGPTCINKVS